MQQSPAGIMVQDPRADGEAQKTERQLSTAAVFQPLEPLDFPAVIHMPPVAASPSRARRPMKEPGRPTGQSQMPSSRRGARPIPRRGAARAGIAHGSIIAQPGSPSPCLFGAVARDSAISRKDGKRLRKPPQTGSGAGFPAPPPSCRTGAHRPDPPRSARRDRRRGAPHARAQRRSKRSAFITLTQAATKSCTNRSCASSWA